MMNLRKYLGGSYAEIKNESVNSLEGRRKKRKGCLYSWQGGGQVSFFLHDNDKPSLT